MSNEPYFPQVKVKLTGTDGNAMAIIGAVSKAMRKAGLQGETAKFVHEATRGDYDHLLQTCFKYVTIK